MNIQSISIVVPTKKCINNCKFCISRMHGNPYENCFDEFQIQKRIKFALNEKVNTCVITGTGEPLQNKKFLSKLLDLFRKMDHPFPRVEFQTSGVMLMDYHEAVVKSGYDNIELLKNLGVDTISFSVSDIFNSENNLSIIGVPKNYRFNLEDLCIFIKNKGFNLRLSLNMTNIYDKKYPEDIIDRCKELGANQITFRKLYGGGEDNPESIWVDENACHETVFTRISEYITGFDNADWGGEGIPCYRLPFGAIAYSINGMTVVIDDNCMGKNDIENLKFIILRENGKLYSQWDDEGSLIF